jgi:subtilisin family serine protease
MASFLSLIAASPGVTQEVTSGASGLGMNEAARSKIIQSAIIDRLELGEKTVDVMILLKGHEDYVGKIDADKPEEMKMLQREIHQKQDLVLNRLIRGQSILKHRFDNINGFAASISRSGLEALAQMPEVESIEEDGKVEAHDTQGIAVMNGSRLPSSYNGTGVSIAIVDTGIDYTHPMLGGSAFPNSKVIGGYDFGDNDSDPMDCQGHGTSVAGIAAGTIASGPGDYIGGVANNARLYALKIVTGCGNSAAFSTIVSAWDWAVTHKNGSPANPILIINTSFGGGRYYSSCDTSQPTLAAAAKNAAANGIAIFVSSGNDGYTNSIAAPACLTKSISVGAVYDANVGFRNWGLCTDATTAADLVPCYSNSSNFLNILASSNDAYTTAVGGGYTPYFGGTSAAAPYAAGAGALIQSYARANTGQFLSAQDVRTRLVETGDPVTDPKSGITTPRVNVLASFVDALFNLSCSHSPVRIAGVSPSYYYTLQDAYNNASNGAIIQSTYGIYPEILSMNRNLTVTFNGGYDCDFPQKLLGNTTISKSIITTSGSITVTNLNTKK